VPNNRENGHFSSALARDEREVHDAVDGSLDSGHSSTAPTLRYVQSRQRRADTALSTATKLPMSSPVLRMGSIPEVRTTNADTAPPTASPIRDLFANHVPPSQPEPWYFNYDTSSRYGPGELALYRIPLPMIPNATTAWSGSTILQVGVREDPWGQVQSPPPEQNYWTEFTDAGFGPYQGVLQIHDPTERNMCAVGQQQSPIDVRPTNGVDAICREEHQVRTLPGDYPIRHHHVEKRIESNKLRLVYPRRPCGDLTKVECQEPDPPQADFPNGWGGFADVLHVDFKVPSEHVLEGERFDAEMQIFHIHAGRRRLAAHSVLIRARDNGFNYYFQEALDAFLEEYDKNRELCMQRKKAQWVIFRMAGKELATSFISILSYPQSTPLRAKRSMAKCKFSMSIQPINESLDSRQ
jgi:hypothetical protein